MTGPSRAAPDDALFAAFDDLRGVSPPSDLRDAIERRVAATPQLRPRLGLVQFAGIAAALVALVGIGLVGAGWNRQNLGPSASPAVASGFVTSHPPSTAPTPTESASPTGLVAGGLARATHDVGIASIATVLAGQTVFIVAGPIEHEGVPSYRVQHYGDLQSGYRPAGSLGWITVAKARESFVPRNAFCPDEPLDLLRIASVVPFERLLCFGARELSFGPVTASTASYGPGLSDRWLSVDGYPDFLTGMPYLMPDGAADIADGAWVTVTGHFDDPSAAACGEPGQVAFCREQFHVTAAVAAEPPGFVAQGTWRTIHPPPIDGRTDHAMAWTGTEAVIWGGISSSADPDQSVFAGTRPRNGAAYDPVSDTWRAIPNAPIPGRSNPILSWTGQEVVAFGGWVGEKTRLDGAAWNPQTNRWRTLPESPLTGTEPVGAWLRGRLYVVTSTSAASWDSATNAWATLPAAPIRPGWRTAAVAADRLFLIAYGDGGTPPVEWAVLDPVTGTWRHGEAPLEPMTAGVRFVGAGDRIVVTDTGDVFDPVTERWSQTTRCEGVSGGTVWTGRYLLGVGGMWDSRQAGGDCLQMPLAPPRDAPFDDTNGREFPAAVWTGRQYITWSGGTGGDISWVPKDGAIFTPTTDLGPCCG